MLYDIRRSRMAMPIAPHWRWPKVKWPIAWQSTVASAIFKLWFVKILLAMLENT